MVLTMAKRTYDQPTCGLATALDLLGERWTLLIVRELMPGPKRYSDLATALPGLGTNLLAERLKHLEQHAIAERRILPPPAASTVYELTDLGRELEPVLLHLAQWGARFRTEPCAATLKPEHIMFELFAAFDSAASAGVDELYHYRVECHEVLVHVASGAIRAGSGLGRRPDVTVSTDTATFLEVLRGRVGLTQAISASTVTIEGPADAAERAFSLFRR